MSLTAENLEFYWRLLESERAESDQLRIRELVESGAGTRSPLIGLDGTNRRMTLFPVEQGTSVTEDTSTGVQIVFRSFFDRGEKRSFVGVVCMKPHLNELFTIIVTEIMAELFGDESDRRPDSVARAVLARWRELLAKLPSERPSLEKIAGLFGELWFLRELFRLGNQSLSMWTGPGGGRHDFVGGSTAVEVKSILRRHGWGVRIHGIDQLDNAPQEALYLAVFKLELNPNGSSVVDMHDDLVAAGADESELVLTLAQAGFPHSVFEQCADVRFNVIDTRIYHVDDRFPKIVNRSFADGGIPPEITYLEYDVELSSGFPIPLEPDQATDVLSGMIKAAE